MTGEECENMRNHNAKCWYKTLRNDIYNYAVIGQETFTQDIQNAISDGFSLSFVPSDKYETLLYLALRELSNDAINMSWKVLLEFGSDPNQLNIFGQNALIFAITTCPGKILPSIFKKLLPLIHDINLKDIYGHTALKYASLNYIYKGEINGIYKDIVKLLLDAGAEKCQLNKFDENVNPELANGIWMKRDKCFKDIQSVFLTHEIMQVESNRRSTNSDSINEYDYTL